eukprot:3134469-Rhodomonas_salina.1
MTCMQPTVLYAAGNSEVGTKQYWWNLTTQVQIVLGWKFDSVGGCVLAKQLYHNTNHVAKNGCNDMSSLRHNTRAPGHSRPGQWLRRTRAGRLSGHRHAIVFKGDLL